MTRSPAILLFVCLLWLLPGEGSFGEPTQPPAQGQDQAKTHGENKGPEQGSADEEEKPKDDVISQFGAGEDAEGNPLTDEQAFKAIVEQYDLDGDGQLSPEEASALSTDIQLALITDPENARLGELLFYADTVSSTDTGNGNWLGPIARPPDPGLGVPTFSPPGTVAGQTFGNPGGGGGTGQSPLGSPIVTGAQPPRGPAGPPAPPTVVRQAPPPTRSSSSLAAGIAFGGNDYFGSQGDFFTAAEGGGDGGIDGEKLFQLERNLGSAGGRDPAGAPRSGTERPQNRYLGEQEVVSTKTPAGATEVPAASAPTNRAPSPPPGTEAPLQVATTGDPAPGPEDSRELVTVNGSFPRAGVADRETTGDQAVLVTATGTLRAGSQGITTARDGADGEFEWNAEATSDSFFAPPPERDAWEAAWDSIRTGVEKVVSRLSELGRTPDGDPGTEVVLPVSENGSADGEETSVVSLTPRSSLAPDGVTADGLTEGEEQGEELVSGEGDRPTGLSDFMQEMLRRKGRQS